jgi:signal transduction histidine kinase
MRYLNRAYQPDTTVVSNDSHRHHRASQNESRPGSTGDRVDALGGTISVASPSSGTTLLVELPMTPE